MKRILKTLTGGLAALLLTALLCAPVMPAFRRPALPVSVQAAELSAQQETVSEGLAARPELIVAEEAQPPRPSRIWTTEAAAESQPDFDNDLSWQKISPDFIRGVITWIIVGLVVVFLALVALIILYIRKYRKK